MEKVFKHSCSWMSTAIKYVLGAIIVITIGVTYSCEKAADTVEINTSNDNETTMEAASSTEAASFNFICVHVTGCVVQPGVYNLMDGSRVYEVIEAAGGFTEEADREFLNLASVIKDGQRIHVYSLEEAATAQTTYSLATDDETKRLLININTATKEQLMTLPGIGESRATSIIAYREENGGFSTKEDIMKVSGIKESAFKKIKDYICTN